MPTSPSNVGQLVMLVPSYTWPHETSMAGLTAWLRGTHNLQTNGSNTALQPTPIAAMRPMSHSKLTCQYVRHT